MLDLGSAIGGNLELYHELADAVAFVDLARACGLGGDRGAIEPDRPARVVSEVVAADSRPLGLVMAWDLFDYLGEEAVERLVRVIADRCARGATLLAFVTDTGAIPSRPGRWVIRAAGRIAREAGPEAALGPGPGWSPARVARLLTGFAVERTFVLACGIREYLAVRG